VSRSISSAVDSTKDGLRSISLAARTAPSVALALLAADVIEKMLLLSDRERKGVFPFPVTAECPSRNQYHTHESKALWARNGLKKHQVMTAANTTPMSAVVSLSSIDGGLKVIRSA
jgi:hypothetical protein